MQRRLRQQTVRVDDRATGVQELHHELLVLRPADGAGSDPLAATVELLGALGLERIGLLLQPLEQRRVTCEVGEVAHRQTVAVDVGEDPTGLVAECRVGACGSHGSGPR